MAFEKSRVLMDHLANNPEEVNKLAQQLAEKGWVPPSLEHVDRLKATLNAKRQQTQLAGAQQAVQPGGPMPSPQGPVAAPQQAQAVNQQLGVASGPNPYMLR